MMVGPLASWSQQAAVRHLGSGIQCRAVAGERANTIKPSRRKSAQLGVWERRPPDDKVDGHWPAMAGSIGEARKAQELPTLDSELKSKASTMRKVILDEGYHRRCRRHHRTSGHA